MAYTAGNEFLQWPVTAKSLLPAIFIASSKTMVTMIANYPSLSQLLYANLPNGIAWAMANASINAGKSQKWILQKMRSRYHTHMLQKSEALSILEKLEEYQRLIAAAIEEIKTQYPS